MNQHKRFTKELAAEAVALLPSSGRTRRQVADDLGIGLSTLARWPRDSRDRVDGKSSASDDEDIVAELKRLRRENDVLRQERDILKKATVFCQGGKSIRFALIDQAKNGKRCLQAAASTKAEPMAANEAIEELPERLNC